MATAARRKTSLSTWFAVGLGLFAAYVAWRWYVDRMPRYQDATAAASARRPSLASLPNGTPIRLADAMRLSVDDDFPRIEDTTVSVVHGEDEPRSFIDDVVARLNKSGAQVSVLAPESAKFSKSFDARGVARYDLGFLVYDRTMTQPGYPASQVVKLNAIYLQGAQQRPKLYSLVFATPNNPPVGVFQAGRSGG